MDFALNADEQLLVDTLQRLLDKECPTTLLREVIEEPGAWARLWPALAPFAGLGQASVVQRALAADQLGYVAAPGPIVAHIAQLVPLVSAAGWSRADDAAAGAVTGTVAVSAIDGAWSPNTSTTRALVADVDAVDVIAVVEPDGVRLMPASQAGAVKVATLDPTRSIFEVAIDGDAGERLAVEPGLIARWQQEVWVAAAAELVGVARRLLDMAVEYASGRVQFDRPIGSFQAIQHKLADVGLDVARARAAVAYAAMAVDESASDVARAVHVAKAAAIAAATRAARDSIQTHGGIGYTWDHDLHLFIRRAHLLATLTGTREWHHRRLAELLIDEPA